MPKDFDRSLIGVLEKFSYSWKRSAARDRVIWESRSWQVFDFFQQEIFLALSCRKRLLKIIVVNIVHFLTFRGFVINACKANYCIELIKPSLDVSKTNKKCSKRTFQKEKQIFCLFETVLMRADQEYKIVMSYTSKSSMPLQFFCQNNENKTVLRD